MPLLLRSLVPWPARGPGSGQSLPPRGCAQRGQDSLSRGWLGSGRLIQLHFLPWRPRPGGRGRQGLREGLPGPQPKVTELPASQTPSSSRVSPSDSAPSSLPRLHPAATLPGATPWPGRRLGGPPWPRRSCCVPGHLAGDPRDWLGVTPESSFRAGTRWGSTSGDLGVGEAHAGAQVDRTPSPPAVHSLLFLSPRQPGPGPPFSGRRPLFWQAPPFLAGSHGSASVGTGWGPASGSGGGNRPAPQPILRADAVAPAE